MHGPGTGWELHEYRHSRLTELGVQGASLLMLMAKSRHMKPESVRRYFKPSHEAICELTSLLAPTPGAELNGRPDPGGLPLSWTAHPPHLPDELARNQQHSLVGGRITALRALVSEMPPAIPAQAVDYAPQRAERHAKASGMTWVDYVPTRRGPGGLTTP